MRLVKTGLIMLGNIKAAYCGQYTSKNQALNQIKQEVKNIDITGTGTDKYQLRNDFNAFLNDFKKVSNKRLAIK